MAGAALRWTIPVFRAGQPAADALRNGGRGSVASVHRRAVNLLLGNGSLVGLLPPGRPIHPWAITAPADSCELEAGSPVVAADGIVTVGGMRLDLHRAELVDLRHAAHSIALDPSIGRVLLKLSDPFSHHDIFDSSLYCGLHAFQTWADASALAGLVGVGNGLTPSGDDIVVGSLAGLELAQNLSPSARTLRHTLIAELPKNLHQHTTKLLSMGHRSGRDTLRGLGAAIVAAFAAGPNPHQLDDSGTTPCCEEPS